MKKDAEEKRRAHMLAELDRRAIEEKERKMRERNQKLQKK